MSRPRPVELEFTAHDDPEVLGTMAVVEAGGTGWINLEPVVDDDHQPPEPGPFAFLGGSTHRVPVATWVPGRRPEGAEARPAAVGLQHATGPRVAGRLRDLGVPLPEGWRVTQDHPRRGLVVTVPAGTDHGTVLEWLLRAAAAVCQVETTGRWRAEVHAGRP